MKMIIAYSKFFFIIFLISFSANAQKIESTVVHPEWSYDKTIYEVNIRQYTDEGTFNAFAEDLPRLKELGVGIIWLMPIHPIGEKNRKGTLGSYYSVKDYLDVNPEFGSKEDFRKLVEKIHENDMYVIIDWVANHTSWDNKMIEDHPEWFTKDSAGNFIPPVADWHDVVDLNYENKDLRNYMIGALEYWVKEFDIDGYRCDIAGTVPIEFWNQARKKLDEIKPVFMLAEDEKPIMHSEAFDMSYSWGSHKLFNEIVSGEKTADDLAIFLAQEMKEFPENAFRMYFTSNHDENSWNGTVFERLGEGAETFAVLTFMLPGMPLIYNGQEAGLSKRLEFFEKDTIEWREHKFFDLYKKLIELKKVNEILWCGEKGGSFEFLPTDVENVFSFVRQKDDKKIIAVFNLSPKSNTITLNGEILSKDFHEVFSKEKLAGGKNTDLSLRAWDYKIYISD